MDLASVRIEEIARGKAPLKVDAPALMPPCPKCDTSVAVRFLGRTRLFRRKGAPPAQVFACGGCGEDFALEPPAPPAGHVEIRPGMPDSARSRG